MKKLSSFSEQDIRLMYKFFFKFITNDVRTWMYSQDTQKVSSVNNSDLDGDEAEQSIKEVLSGEYGFEKYFRLEKRKNPFCEELVLSLIPDIDLTDLYVMAKIG